jgi:hypothetical protein
VVLESSGQVLGYGVLEYSFFSNGFISMLCIAASARRQGLGSALLEALASRCRTAKLFTSTNASNHAMRALLRGRGSWRAASSTISTRGTPSASISGAGDARHEAMFPPGAGLLARPSVPVDPMLRLPRLACALVSVALLAPAQVPAPAPAAVTASDSCDFRSLRYLLDREAWPRFLAEGNRLRSGKVAVGLAEPAQVVFLVNGWHLPMTSGWDIRVQDMEKHVFKATLEGTFDWPAYDAPGFVALVRKPDLEWILVARPARHYLIEDRWGVVVVPAGP